jgi:hypothetical protein
MTQIRPGLYRDANGQLCLYMTAFLQASGLPATPEIAKKLRCQFLFTMEFSQGKTVMEMMD